MIYEVIVSSSIYETKSAAIREPYDNAMCEFIRKYKDGELITFCMKERLTECKDGKFEGYCCIMAKSIAMEEI